MRQRVEELQRRKVRDAAGGRHWETGRHRQPVTSLHTTVQLLLQAEAQQQLEVQRQRQQRAQQRAERLLKQVQAKGAAGCKLPEGLTLEGLAADVQLALVKEATRGMVEALRGAAEQHPHLSLVRRVEAEAGIKLAPAGEPASRPGSGGGGGVAAVRSSLCRSPAGSLRGSPAGSRPGSAASVAGSPLAAGRSGACVGGRASRCSPVKAPAVVDVALQL